MSEPTVIGECIELPLRYKPLPTEGFTGPINGVRWNFGLQRPEAQCHFCGEWVSAWHGPAWTHAGGELVQICERCVRECRHAGASETGPAPLAIPAEYEMVSLRWWNADIQAFAKAWPDKTPLAGVLGCHGSGKTALCWAIARERNRAKLPVVVIDVPTMRELWLADIRRRQLDRHAKPVEDIWISTPYLILDSLHEGVATEGWADCLHRVVNLRIQAKRATFLTTAHAGEEIERRYGPSLRSRMRMFDWETLPEKDHRAKGGSGE